MAATQRTIQRVPDREPDIKAERARGLSVLRFLTGRVILMAENGEKANGKLTIPYPMVATAVGVFIWIAGASVGGVYAFATLSANVQSLSNTMLLRDADVARREEAQRKQIDELRQKLETQQQYIDAQNNKVWEIKGELSAIKKGQAQ